MSHTGIHTEFADNMRHGEHFGLAQILTAHRALSGGA
jgi:hypothetical protein